MERMHIVFSTGTEKDFDKLQHPFFINTLKQGIKGTYLNKIKLKPTFYQMSKNWIFFPKL